MLKADLKTETCMTNTSINLDIWRIEMLGMTEFAFEIDFVHLDPGLELNKFGIFGDSFSWRMDQFFSNFKPISRKFKKPNCSG